MAIGHNGGLDCSAKVIEIRTYSDIGLHLVDLLFRRAKLNGFTGQPRPPFIPTRGRGGVLQLIAPGYSTRLVHVRLARALRRRRATAR